VLRRAKNYSDNLLLSTGTCVQTGARRRPRGRRGNTDARPRAGQQAAMQLTVWMHRRLNVHKAGNAARALAAGRGAREACIYAVCSPLMVASKKLFPRVRDVRRACARKCNAHIFFPRVGARRAKFRRLRRFTAVKKFFSADAKIVGSKSDLRKIAQNCAKARAMRRVEKATPHTSIDAQK